MKKEVFTLLFLLIITSIFVGNTFGQSATPVKNSDNEDVSSYLYKPSVRIGTGLLTYHGNLNSGDKVYNFSSFRMGYLFGVDKRVTKAVGFSADVLYGTLAYNVLKPADHRNFETGIISGEVSIKAIIDNNVLPKMPAKIGIFFSAGIGFVSFKPKADLLDANNKPYFYWSDGTIRSLPQAGNPAEATMLHRDYKYETVIKDSVNGTFATTAIYFPLKAGITLKISKAFETDFAITYHYALTDYLDGYKSSSANNDSYILSSVAFRYNLGIKPPKSDPSQKGGYTVVEMIDTDEDGIRDFEDVCPDTPKGIFVDAKGCPRDDDNDGVPDYKDKQPNTPKGVVVDIEGVAISDANFKTEKDSTANEGMLRENVSEVTILGPKGTKQAFIPNFEKLIKPGTTFLPKKYRTADANNDGYISPEEVITVIDKFFDGGSSEFNTSNKINELIDFFFEQ